MKTAPSRALVACLFFLALASSCKKDISLTLQRAEDQTIETVSAIHSARSISINNNCGGFYEALPARYDSSAKKYPLILFIHGIGELGNGKSDLPNMLRAGLPRLINRKLFPPSFESGGHHYSFIVLAPQFKKWPSPEEVKGVLTYALKTYRIDTTRIYITGLSMGGGVTWEFAAQFGDNVAASIPICGGSSPNEARAKKIASFNLPVWAFHNEDDKTVPVSFSTGYVSTINKFKPATPAMITVWPSGGHDSWTKAYDPATKEKGKNIYEWMLQYRRS